MACPRRRSVLVSVVLHKCAVAALQNETGVRAIIPRFTRNHPRLAKLPGRFLRTHAVEQSWARTPNGEFPVLPQPPQALLALADGTVFRGTSIGAAGHTVGEVVFNTALTGYQEILTDPSYCKQIVTLT